ncbi:hypothetical protein ASG84_22100 [Rhodococcus sp. Leaf278]|uniref:hypothetical protein n=1 Tax=Rhodococcus sp. Leaf278 TaxID=1736319 RepID=UPI00070DF366|nr:hypothetical protein [Rhodococcus sp. Leaf278]KQU55495.1 hypothetical protein ASG84_22100 [Rhodococcus sp. Leaf278]
MGNDKEAAGAGDTELPRYYDPETVELFYNESKSAADEIKAVIPSFRTNATVVLAIATGAAAFFGFDDASKQPILAYLALGSYAAAAVAAACIFLPKTVAYNVGRTSYDYVYPSDRNNVPAKGDLQLDYARQWQSGITATAASVKSVASYFTWLVVLVVAAVIFAGLSVTYGPETTPQPTEITIKDERQQS